MRRRPVVKLDGNHGVIAAGLESAGCGVADLSAVGDGVADLLVHAPVWPFEMTLLEVKDPAQPPNKRKLTPAQEKFHARWRGRLFVVETLDEALAVVGLKAAA